MNRSVAGVIVALMLVGTVALMSGCGGSESTPAGGAGVAQPAGGGTGGPSAEDRPMSDDQLKVFVQTMPKEQWEQTPFAKRSRVRREAPGREVPGLPGQHAHSAPVRTRSEEPLGVWRRSRLRRGRNPS